MGFITTATRIWLTKTVKPFIFQNEYDNFLDFENTQQLGLYIHIPFCRSLCSFCPYCKVRYNYELCSRYIDSLIEEIHLAGRNLKQKKQVTSLYFGGGSPFLAKERLKEIIGAVEKYFIITEGIGLELHPSEVEKNNLVLLKHIGITKISIGIQSFQRELLKSLGRRPVDFYKMFEALDCVSFETVSMDFIFALPGQTFQDLKKDIHTAFSHGANHIAVYPFIDFSFTDSRLMAVDNKKKRKLLDGITLYCKKKGYKRESIWTFSKQESAKYSSMTRNNFLGFGCSATTLLKNQFKINTFSVEEYGKRIRDKRLPTSLTLRFTKRQRMVYYLFWTAYSTKIHEEDFERFFGEPLNKYFGLELKALKALGFVTKKNKVYEMTLKGAFYYHFYENFYTLAYIDKMWGIMRREAFPEKITL